MSDAEMESHAREAINQYLAKITYPMLWASERIVTLGTSVLFRYEDRHFLLTAAHLFSEYNGPQFPYDGLVGPISRAKNAPRALGRINVYEPRDEATQALDVIAIELLDLDFIKAIQDTWTFISIEDFASPNPSSVYFVSGFPKERERREGEMVGAALLSLTTNQREDIPDAVEHFDERVDFLLKYDNIASNFYNNNTLEKAPTVYGVSGGPVFRVSNDPPTMWTPRTGTRFVGLQSSTSKAKEWLRVKSTNAIAMYFGEAIPMIGAAIQARISQ